MGAPLIKWKPYGLKHPLSRAHNLGSAHHGVHHWIAQRLTAVLLIPLQLWLAYAVVHAVHTDYTGFIVWLSQPWNTILMILTVFTMFYHAILGCQVVIEDYIHNEAFKLLKLYGMKIVLITIGLVCVYSILKVAL